MVTAALRRRVVSAGNYFVGPGTEITRMTCFVPENVRQSGPGTWAASSLIRKGPDRNVWIFDRDARQLL